MSNYKLAAVPREWWEKKSELAKQLGLTTCQTIKFHDEVVAKILKKRKYKGKTKFEIEI